jgi:transposase
MVQTKPAIIELDMGKLEDALHRAEAKLDHQDYAMLRTLAESYAYLSELVGERTTTLARLRNLLFGAKTEKTATVVGRFPVPGFPPSPNPPSPPATSVVPPSEDAAQSDSATAGRARNHGRNGADAYAGAEKIDVLHPSLAPGDPCPQCAAGTVYETGRPGVVLRLVGQAPLAAKVYYLQKLRCNLCGGIFGPPPPEGHKYDATAGSMMALLKYGTGMPFHRAEKLQASLGIPLPASTQWDIVAAQAERAEPVWEELIRQAAQGEVVHNDDTTVKILAAMGPRAEPTPHADSNAAVPQNSKAERKGTFTSGIVATQEGRRIALFFSGRQHAGENLADVLARRQAELPPPIQMCDALARNLPGELKTLVANCLAHARRQFVDVAQQFPEECRHVLESLAVVYHNDAVARTRNLVPQERLLWHQAHSGPALEDLHGWLGQQLDQRRVEPNSGLGKAMAYLLRHWQKLTLFLRVPGAPLDNNLCERALKKAIRHRRNSLFYKTYHGAHVGDVFMSLIHTCELCGANPFNYLTQLERHADQSRVAPQNWMPWNYHATLERINHGQTPSAESGQDERPCSAAAQGAGETRES